MMLRERKVVTRIQIKHSEQMMSVDNCIEAAVTSMDIKEGGGRNKATLKEMKLQQGLTMKNSKVQETIKDRQVNK